MSTEPIRFLLLCLAAWGEEPLKRTVNACSLLQCMHHCTCSPNLKPLRNEAAFALQSFLDDPSVNNRIKAESVRRKCEEIYDAGEDNPDSDVAVTSWYHLGAPWFGLETALDDLSVREDYGEIAPAPANSSWCIRNAVWPERAFDAAAKWSSVALVSDAVKTTLLVWAVGKRDTNS